MEAKEKKQGTITKSSLMNVIARSRY